MTGNFSPISQTDLAQRRQKLRRQRRVRLAQTVWRLVAVAGLAGGVIWLSTNPIWLIRSANQIKVEGNQFLPTPTVRSLLPLTYPQSLLQVEPQTIEQTLKAKAPIAEVAVSRQLFPPGLTIRIRERLPVAVWLSTPGEAQLLTQRPTPNQNLATKIGLLDESGGEIALENFLLTERSLKLPTLRVIGDVQHYRPIWAKLYRELIRSPVKIAEIDFQNPANVVLKTELGNVQIGSYTDLFPEQLKTLDRMRKLPNQVSLNQIAYIDLRNPASPTIQMKSAVESPKPEEPTP